jgi:hypothetical protein
MKILITESKKLRAINWVCDRFVEHNSDYVKDVDVYDKGYNDNNAYSVRITYYNGPDSKFWPLTQSKRNQQDEIADKLWNEIYNLMKEPIGIYIDR